jgi:calcineurin-like phosphoesterase family protein
MAQHVPPSAPGEIPDYIDLVLCGHVHKAWRHAIREGIPIINVGVDAWDYTPVSVNTILKEYHRIMNSE